MTNSNSKGNRTERELVNWLAANGWAVLRAPASGSATERDLPDVLAGNGDRFIATENKASGGDPIYLTREEVEALQFFAENFGAEARISVKFDVEHGDPAYGDDDRPGFRFLDPDDLHVTSGGNHRVKKSEAQELGVREVDL